MRLLSLLTLLMVLVSGCSSQPEQPLPYPFTVTLDIADNVNPYGTGSAHPVVIRIYQLSETGQFKNASFLELYNKDRDTLGNALIDVLNLQPLAQGEHPVELDLQPGSRYLGVFAEFANYTDAESKAVITLLPDQSDQEDQIIRINLNGLKISIEQYEDKAWWQVF